MKERPILFSTPMVQALIADRKTQTRRIVKPTPGRQSEWLTAEGINRVPHGEMVNGGWQMHHPRAGTEVGGVRVAHDSPYGFIRCPYGQPGDLLWVRETWAAPHAYDHLPPRMIPQHATIHYAATEERGGLLWRPSIHMPCWASRLTLSITDVRVERLQGISGMDAKREGAPVPAHIPEDGADLEWARGWYRLLWEEINGAGCWALCAAYTG